MENKNRNTKPAQDFKLENITIPYNTEHWQPRNFRGLQRVNQKTGKIVNNEGQRNFCIFLDPTQVDPEQMKADGWNISKTENPKDPQADPSYMLRVKVRWHPEGSDMARRNPKIRVCTQNGFMMMDEENVGDLDNAQIVKASVTIHGTWSDTPTYTGYVAYLSKLVVRVYEEEDSLDDLMEGLMD